MRAIQQGATVPCDQATTGEGQGAGGAWRATSPRCAGSEEESPIHGELKAM